MSSYGNFDQGGGSSRPTYGSASTWHGRIPSITYDNDDVAPKLAATFYPGGADDFMMPELVSPSPQRIMTEVPLNIQEGIARLELEGDNLQRYEQRRTNSVSPVSSEKGHRRGQESITAKPQVQEPPQVEYAAPYQRPNSSMATNPYEQAPRPLEIRKSSNNASDNQFPAAFPKPSSINSNDDPFPSPFPKLRNPGPNIPPSNDEKEDILENERVRVLKSNDPEVQLTWAQSALLWVDGAIQSRVRDSPDNSSRSITPRVEHQLRIDAISIIKFLADQNHPRAVFLRSLWYEFGKFGYALDRKEAFQGYRTAAEQGFSRAEYRIGTQYESMRDMGKAIKHYNIGIAMNDSAANYRLGMMNLLGQHGQEQDYELGIKRIRFAAQTADENAAQGAYVYGMLLGRELPNITIPENILPVDFEQARIYIEKAAYLGFAKAQTKMGQAYELCSLNCDFNPALSLHYSALAARQGDPDAELAVSKWFICGYEGIFEKNDELAFNYAQRAAKSGLATAEIAMGYFYEIGMHVPIDIVQAQSWYQKAADHGHKEALGRLEGLQQHKALSKKDHEQIAITRIRSQYGSRQGGRRNRSQDRYSSPLPAVTETTDGVQDRYSQLPASKLTQDRLPDRYSSLPSAAETQDRLQDRYSQLPAITQTQDRLPDRYSSLPPATETQDRLQDRYSQLPAITQTQDRIPDRQSSLPTATESQDRLQDRYSQFPTVTQTPASPEDPRRYSHGYLTADPLVKTEENLQSRPKSVAPYPEDNVAPRPGSTQPRPQSRLMREGPIADRPLSAFGIRTPAAPPNPFNEVNYSGNPVRPATGQSFHFVPAGRGSNPAGRDRVVSAGWEPQRPAAYGRELSPRRTPFPPDIPPQQRPYGSNQDGRNRLQKPQTPLPVPQSQAPYPQTPQSRPATLARERHGSLPNQLTDNEHVGQWDDRPQFANEPPGRGGRRPPERNESMPESRSRQRPIGQTLNPSQLPRSSSTSPSIPAALSVQSAVPPKKGAQSFEEMGIPHSKNESDCLVM